MDLEQLIADDLRFAGFTEFQVATLHESACQEVGSTKTEYAVYLDEDCEDAVVFCAEMGPRGPVYSEYSPSKQEAAFLERIAAKRAEAEYAEVYGESGKEGGNPLPPSARETL